MKTFFTFLLGMFVMAGAIVLYKEAPTIIKNWDNKPDVSVNDNTTDDSTTTTTDDSTTTTDNNATVQSNDSTYDNSTYDDSTYDDSTYDESAYDDSTYDDSTNVDLPPLPINNELNALHNLRSICHQLQDIDRAVNEYPVFHPCY